MTYVSDFFKIKENKRINTINTEDRQGYSDYHTSLCLSYPPIRAGHLLAISLLLKRHFSESARTKVELCFSKG
jgi:hypothetical protein